MKTIENINPSLPICSCNSYGK